mgnify:CR=1 FL=1
MKCTVLHENKGRIRVHFDLAKMSLKQAECIEEYFTANAFVIKATVYDKTCDAVVLYHGSREAVIALFAALKIETAEEKYLSVIAGSKEINRTYRDKILGTVLIRYAKKLLLPVQIRNIITSLKALKYIIHGLKSLLSGKIEVALLDATAITVALLTGDFETAGSIMFLLRIGEILEEWTHKKSLNDLAHSMAINVKTVWVLENGTEVQKEINEISKGDTVIVRHGSIVPFDGKVVAGEAMVNEASMTGEALPVRKNEGAYAFAGTVVEEGEFRLVVDKVNGQGRYSQIASMIESSEKLKSSTESKASHLADRLVPYSLGGTLLTYLLTRNITKTLSVLMVDFSCALKLSIPIVVLSAIREARSYGILVKGGKFFESVSRADTLVFDKTGTLTYAQPTVRKIVTFSDHDENECLRLAACLEEHFPHSIANAVVNEAIRRNLHHEERHSKVEYVIAHGIASSVDGEKVIIGSYHFVFEDEGCIIPEKEKDKFNLLPEDCSHLYLAKAGTLIAVICIDDPLRKEAYTIVDKLHKADVKKVIMMTGDNEKTASAVAKVVGVDAYYSSVLPEDKANYVKAEQEKGHTVMMTGDGINDSPALSQADVGIAVSEGSELAREISDVTISSDNIEAILTLKKLSDAMQRKIRWNYRTIISFNSLLIALGLLGIIMPTTSATLHNLSTLLISLIGMRNLLKSGEDTEGD